MAQAPGEEGTKWRFLPGDRSETRQVLRVCVGGRFPTQLCAGNPRCRMGTLLSWEQSVKGEGEAGEQPGKVGFGHKSQRAGPLGGEFAPDSHTSV